MPVNAAGAEVAAWGMVNVQVVVVVCYFSRYPVAKHIIVNHSKNPILERDKNRDYVGENRGP